MKEKIIAIMNNPDSFKEKISCLINENPDKKEYILNCVEKELKSRSAQLDKDVLNITVRMQLSELIEILPLSYIAKTYFNKTRQWLYQRINGSIVNGKPAKFTEDEIKILNIAIHDIGKKLDAVNIV